MPIPLAPLRTGDIEADLEALYQYVQQVQLQFANAVGYAVDPSMGEGGDASLTITDSLTNIVYTPGVELTVDGILIGHIDISFTKSDRSVDVIVFYREQGVANFKQSYASESPFRLISLRADTTYELQLAGQAANGSLGPMSTLTSVVVSTMSDVSPPLNLAAQATYQSVVLTWDAPVSVSLLKYEVQRASDAVFVTDLTVWDVYATRFVDDIGIIGTLHYYRVRAVDTIGGRSAFTATVSATTLNVPNASIDTQHLVDSAVTTAKIANLAVTTGKIADDAVTYAKIQNVSAASRILLRGSAAGAGDVQEGTAGTGLTISGTVLQLTDTIAQGTYTPTLVNTANITASTAYTCQYIRINNAVIVSGRVDVDPTAAGSTRLSISLPVASNLAATENLAGTAFNNAVAGLGAAIYADTAGDTAFMEWNATDTANRAMYFTFMYRIL